MLRIAVRKWPRAAITVLFVAACGGCAQHAGPSASAQGTSTTATSASGSASQEPPAAIPCPTGQATARIAGLPAMSLPCLADAGSTIPVAAVSGRPEVINFWASWCDPCRREATVLEDAYRTYGDQVTFLGVDSRDDRQAALRFVADSGATYPHVFDTGGTLALQLGLTVMPYTVFVDDSGRIVDRHAGELTRERLDSALARLGVGTGTNG